MNNNFNNVANAANAFGDWLQEQESSYAIFIVKGEHTRFMLYGDTADVISSIATAIIDNEQARHVVMEALKLAADVIYDIDNA